MAIELLCRVHHVIVCSSIHVPIRVGTSFIQF